MNKKQIDVLQKPSSMFKTINLLLLLFGLSTIEIKAPDFDMNFYDGDDDGDDDDQSPIRDMLEKSKLFLRSTQEGGSGNQSGVTRGGQGGSQINTGNQTFVRSQPVMTNAENQEILEMLDANRPPKPTESSEPVKGSKPAQRSKVVSSIQNLELNFIETPNRDNLLKFSTKVTQMIVDQNPDISALTKAMSKQIIRISELERKLKKSSLTTEQRTTLNNELIIERTIKKIIEKVREEAENNRKIKIASEVDSAKTTILDLIQPKNSKLNIQQKLSKAAQTFVNGKIDLGTSLEEMLKKLSEISKKSDLIQRMFKKTIVDAILAKAKDELNELKKIKSKTFEQKTVEQKIKMLQEIIKNATAALKTVS